MAFIDQYEIGYSQEFSIVGREEKTETLNLTANPSASSGILTGTVTAGGTAVEGATVKVYDTNDNPVEHTNTSAQGKYTIANLPVGSYKVTAVKDGYLLPTTIPVTIQQNRTTTADIALTADPDAVLGTVFGIIRSNLGELPIVNAIVNLYELVASVPTLIATASTNDHGQYLFANLSSGTYHVAASKLGYLPNQTADFLVGTKEFVSSDITLLADSNANTATVSGFINDAVTGLPIANANVALYSVVGTVETVIAIMKTNVAGRYLFAGLLPGNYKVKATKQVEG